MHHIVYLSISQSLNLWQENPIGLRVPSWNRQPPVPKPCIPVRRVSNRIRAMGRSIPIEKAPPFLIDLTARTCTDGGGRVFVLTPRTPQVAKHGAATISSTPVKGKRIIHTIEKGLQIIESKSKRKRPELKH
jgi:hypothetical protein